jgi:hypothetical protein
MTAAAMTGPTPNSPVRQVPAARTASVSFFLVSRIRTSTPRRFITQRDWRSKAWANRASDIRVIISAYRTEKMSDDHPYI